MNSPVEVNFTPCKVGPNVHGRLRIICMNECANNHRVMVDIKFLTVVR